jgi:hypothetical protein
VAEVIGRSATCNMPLFPASPRLHFSTQTLVPPTYGWGATVESVFFKMADGHGRTGLTVAGTGLLLEPKSVIPGAASTLKKFHGCRAGGFRDAPSEILITPFVCPRLSTWEITRMLITLEVNGRFS